MSPLTRVAHGDGQKDVKKGKEVLCLYRVNIYWFYDRSKLKRTKM